MHLTDDPIDRDGLIVATHRLSDGALVLFEGIVRNHHQGRTVKSIFYDAYRPMAEKEIGRIVGEIRAEHPEVTAAVRHRLGLLQVGETSIMIVCSSPHRAEAYEASRKLIDRIKEQVPIWKREHTDDGAVWQGWQGVAQSGRNGPSHE